MSSSSGASIVAGAQEPRISLVPDYVASTGPDAIELAALAGLHLDPWQQLVLTHSLGERSDGKWAAFEVGLVVPRQNGKGSILEARELAGLFLIDEERLIIHSAHEQATSTEHFRRLLGLIESVPELDQRVEKAPKGKGMEAIELKDGSRILFKTRTGGGGRGFTGDLVVLDEAMILAEAFTGALVPTMAARSIHGNPQLIYAGSAVDQQIMEHGVVLARVRDRGLRGAARLGYFEWSADADSPDELTATQAADPETWATANPGLGIRISLEHVENEHNGALGPRQFAVERLNVGDWPATDGGGDGIDGDLWDAALDRASQVLDPVCLAVDTTPNRAMSAVGIAGWREDGLKHIEVIAHRPGTAWVADLLGKFLEKQSALNLKVDARSSLIPELEQAALPVEIQKVSAGEHVQACGAMFDAIHGAEDPETGIRTGQTVRHIGQPELTAAAKGASKRPLLEAFAWNRKSSGVDISPLVACTLALWGCIEAGQSDGGFEWD